MKVVVECGQRWYRPRSWRRPWRSTGPFYWRPLIDRSKNKRIGTAIGPIMFLRK